MKISFIYQLRVLIILFVLFVVASCSDANMNGQHSSLLFDKPSNTSIRALGLNDLYNYKEYDYYLLYLEHRPRQVSYSFSLILKDSILYSYTKYMNNIVSVKYPPVYYQEEDSIYYSVTYREHSMSILDSLKLLINSSNYYNTISPEISFNESDDSRWLLLYDNNGEMKSVYNWRSNNKVEKELVKYIKYSLMNFLPTTESSLTIIDTTTLENHIPKF